jgi:hypothetical protein
MMRIEYVSVPYWRTLRPRWAWIAGGCALGVAVGFLLGFYLGVVIHG